MSMDKVCADGRSRGDGINIVPPAVGAAGPASTFGIGGDGSTHHSVEERGELGAQRSALFLC